MALGCDPSLSWKSVKEMVHEDFPDVDHVSAAELKRSIDSETAPVILDVREQAEYDVSHLPGAIRVQPGSDASEVLENIEPGTSIVAYCSVGYRSSELVQKLSERGFTDVHNLDGAIFEWANAGYPVEREGEAVRDVHPFDDRWGTLLDEELRAYEPRAK